MHTHLLPFLCVSSIAIKDIGEQYHHPGVLHQPQQHINNNFPERGRTYELVTTISCVFQCVTNQAYRFLLHFMSAIQIHKTAEHLSAFIKSCMWCMCSN